MRLSAFLQDTENVFSDLRLNKTKLFGVQDVSNLSSNKLSARFDQWLANAEQLSKWVAYCERASRSRELGLGQLIDQLEDKRLSPDDTAFVFEQAYYEALLAAQIQAEPMLGRFDGTVHGRLTREFADLDRQRIAAARLEVVRAHHRRIASRWRDWSSRCAPRRNRQAAGTHAHPPTHAESGTGHPGTEACRHDESVVGGAVLPPGQLTFDLLVMDEASQIQPVDALGAIADAARLSWSGMSVNCLPPSSSPR